MASLLCKCGNRMSNTEVPNNIEFHVYSDYEWDKILEKDEIFTINIPKPTKEVWKCPQCQRIYIFSSDGLVEKVYKLEE